MGVWSKHLQHTDMPLWCIVIQWNWQLVDKFTSATPQYPFWWITIQNWQILSILSCPWPHSPDILWTPTTPTPLKPHTLHTPWQSFVYNLITIPWVRSPNVFKFHLREKHSFKRQVTSITCEMVDSCVGSLVVMMLAWHVRDWGSIPHWDTEFFCPSEPTVTFGTQNLMGFTDLIVWSKHEDSLI